MYNWFPWSEYKNRNKTEPTLLTIPTNLSWLVSREKGLHSFRGQPGDAFLQIERMGFEIWDCIVTSIFKGARTVPKHEPGRTGHYQVRYRYRYRVTGSLPGTSTNSLVMVVSKEENERKSQSPDGIHQLYPIYRGVLWVL
jgi:hypothetical protein